MRIDKSDFARMNENFHTNLNEQDMSQSRNEMNRIHSDKLISMNGPYEMLNTDNYYKDPSGVNSLRT